MNLESAGNEILEQYKNISSKLKKRFLRKPNVTEACESFTSLGQHCENYELPSYAGLCWIAAARCEGSLGNVPGETSCLVRSARNFLSAEVKNKNLGCPSPNNENLQAALSCYAHAGTRYPENCPLNVCLNLEIVESLGKLDLKSNCELYLKEALELSQNSLDIKLYCLHLLSYNYIERGDFTTSLDTFTDITNLIEMSPQNGTRSDLLLNCEIYRVLLLLLLKPTPQKLAPDLTRILEKYTWGDKNDKSLKACSMSEELFLLMQSLVLMCQSLDANGLSELEGDFWTHFSTKQKDLLHTLVRIYCY